MARTCEVSPQPRGSARCRESVGAAAVKHLRALCRSLQWLRGQSREAAVECETRRPMSHLWTQVFAQLKHHVRPGETPLDALNGILCEVYGGAAITTAASIRTRTL